MKYVLIVFLLAATLVSVSVAAPLGSNELAAVRHQGSNSLATFAELVTPSNYQWMGFGYPGEIATATNGAPLLIYTIPLNRLISYQTTNSFETLLLPDPQIDPAPVTRVILPILVSTNVRSSTTLRLVPGQPPTWTNANWGYSGLIRNLLNTYSSIPGGEIKNDWPPFVVEIPVFDAWLIGYYNKANKLVLRATTDMRLGPVTVNRNQNVSREAMLQLSLTAQRYNGRPN